jgi:hypothetical protein
MGIIAVLFSISSILMLNLIPKATMTSTSEVIIAELRSQQLRAMSGETGLTSTAQDFGLRIANQEYTLFTGAYNELATDNYDVVVENPITLSTTFANQQIVFSVGSGEIENFISGQDIINVTNNQTGESVIIKLNQYGVIESIN